jgi:ankyrin repeat protein
VQDNRIAEAVAFYEDPLRSGSRVEGEDGEVEKDSEDLEPDDAREGFAEARPYQGKAIVLRDAQLETRVKTAYEYNTLLSKLDIDTVKVQAYILTAVSLNLGQNVLHLACERGNLQLCSFIIDKAGPRELNILPLIINVIDQKERSPLYLLCLRGYVHNHDPYLQLKVGLRKKMIEKLIPPVAKTYKGPLTSNFAHWSFVSEEIKYTAFHWLAYWNDTESLFYLLNQVPESQENYLKILVENERGDTPLGLAAAHGSHESAIMIIEHLVKDFNIIQGVFLDRVHELFKHSSNEKKNAITQQLDTSGQQRWELIFVNTKHLNEDQRRFSKLFYWSAFYGLQDVVFKFLGLGVSPFMKIYNGKNAIDACIEGLQYDLLELLLKDSR